MQLFLRFDAFGRRLHLEVGGEADHRADQRGVAAFGSDAPRTKLWSILILSNGTRCK